MNMKGMTMKLAYGAGLLALGLLASLVASAAPRESVIYRFTLAGDYSPTSVIAGPGGVLYGSLGHFGGSSVHPGGIFKLTPPSPGNTQWTETYINTNGGGMLGGLVLGKDGSLYGTSFEGGKGLGSAFRVTPPGAGQTQWTTTILHSFGGGPSHSDYADGIIPQYGLIAGPDGALYGTTSNGGGGTDPNGFGTVFKLTPPNPGGTEWTYTVLHRFGGFEDNCRQYCAPGRSTYLLLGPGGVLYGTTRIGGPHPSNGTVYQLTPPKAGQAGWGFTILHNFGDNDGVGPIGSLIADANGVLYGTTYDGSGIRGGTGVVFKMTPPTHGEVRWPYNVIHTFTRGGGPLGKLLLGHDGALYGETYGADSVHTCGAQQNLTCGVVFKLSPPPPGTTRWTETVLHDFTGTNGDTYAPYDITFGRDPDGSAAIFGVTYGDFTNQENNQDNGSVFEVKLAP